VESPDLRNLLAIREEVSLRWSFRLYGHLGRPERGLGLPREATGSQGTPTSTAVPPQNLPDSIMLDAIE